MNSQRRSLILTMSLAVCLLGTLTCDICENDGRSITDGRISAGSTQYVNQSGNAEKDCHASFRLEIRWADTLRRRDSLAKSPYSDATDLWYEFCSTGGSFTVFPMMPTKVGVDVGGHREYFWYWSDNVGAKDDPNPTIYAINCWSHTIADLTPPPGRPDYWDVLCHGEIHYTIYREEP